MQASLPYWVAILGTGAIWVGLFKKFPKLRWEMLVTSLLVSPLAIIDYLTVPTYWIPQTLGKIPIGIEAIIFTFSISGIAAIVYEVVFRRYAPKRSVVKSNKILVLLPAFIAAFAVSLIFKLNIIYFVIFFLLVSAFTIWTLRKDLHQNIIISALFFALFYSVSFNLWIIITPTALTWWNLANLSGILLGKIPLEEVLFSLSFGGFVGPLYEFLTGGRDKK